MGARFTFTPGHLGTMALFHGLPDAALNAAARGAHLKRWAKEQCLFAQGDVALHAHALLEGGVRITQAGSDGGQAIMRLIAPGEMFGTVALFTNGRYPAEAVALGDTLVASWRRDQLEALMARYPPIAHNVIRIIGTRLQEAQNRLRELATQRCEHRIAHVLLRLADQAGAAAAGGMAISFPLRRKDIAELAGTTLYTASRVLTAWEKAGWLASQGQRLVILQRSALERLAEEDSA
mgnify:CR=1 FL=1